MNDVFVDWLAPMNTLVNNSTFWHSMLQIPSSLLIDFSGMLMFSRWALKTPNSRFIAAVFVFYALRVVTQVNTQIKNAFL